MSLIELKNSYYQGLSLQPAIQFENIVLQELIHLC